MLQPGSREIIENILVPGQNGWKILSHHCQPFIPSCWKDVYRCTVYQVQVGLTWQKMGRHTLPLSNALERKSFTFPPILVQRFTTSRSGYPEDACFRSSNPRHHREQHWSYEFLSRDAPELITEASLTRLRRLPMPTTPRGWTTCWVSRSSLAWWLSIRQVHTPQWRSNKPLSILASVFLGCRTWSPQKCLQTVDCCQRMGKCGSLEKMVSGVTSACWRHKGIYGCSPMGQWSRSNHVAVPWTSHDYVIPAEWYAGHP